MHGSHLTQLGKGTGMANYADLEIGLHRWDSDSYTVELRFSLPDTQSDIAPMHGVCRFDFDKLRSLELDATAYGQELTQSLFADPTVRASFDKIRVSTQTLDLALRLRLFIGPSASELHSLRWETLRDPQQPTSSLVTNENIVFSRYLSSLDWRPVRLQPQADLRGLVLIANPTDLTSYQPGGRSLAPVDVPGELARAQAGLGPGVTTLAGGGTATLNNLIAQLHDGYDILYLVAHGALIKGEPQLWLEDSSGQAAVVSGTELVTRISELQQPPRLIVLASCQSAGRGELTTSADDGALAALGPRLAAAGILAIVAMQGNITMQTVAAFMPVFFKEMQRDGQVDRAMAAARSVVRERLDSWMPVLFMRLRGGRIWYVPGFASTGAQPSFEKWPALLGNIADMHCTPILGTGLLEPLIGSTRDLAQRWAETYGFPMAPSAREDLPQVAQYLAVNQQPIMPLRELTNYLRLELLRRYGPQLPEAVRGAGIEQVVTAVGQYLRQGNPAEPHKVLAGLPFPIYITTNPDNLLADALIEAGKTPQVELCRWTDEVRWPRSIYETNPDYQPTVEQPLVYHLFGHVKLLDSIVLKEDDYFDYLIGVTSNKEAIPDDVRRALADTALLFLGFRLDDWDFRALFRSFMLSQGGRGRRSHYAHVAAQIDPEEGQNSNPEGARRYLQGYFQDAAISIYWGRVEDFVQALLTRWQTAQQAGGGGR